MNLYIKIDADSSKHKDIQDIAEKLFIEQSEELRIYSVTSTSNFEDFENSNFAEHAPLKDEESWRCVAGSAIAD